MDSLDDMLPLIGQECGGGYRSFLHPLPIDSASGINQFRYYGFFNPFPDAVHPPHPLHLVFRLKLLRHALALSVLLHQQLKHLIGGAVDFFQMGVQLAAEEQTGVETIMVLLEIALPALTPDPYMRG